MDLASWIVQWIILLIILFGGFWFIVSGMFLTRDGMDGTGTVFIAFGAFWEIAVWGIILLTWLGG